MTPDERLRRQRRHLLAGMSACVLVATVAAPFTPAWVVVGLLVWVVAPIGVWVVAWEAGHWWTRRRAEHAFDQHVADVLAVVRTRHPSHRPVPAEDQPGWDLYRRGGVS